MSEAPGAMPAMPVALSVWATMVPATCVPWPLSSVTSVLFHISFRGDDDVDADEVRMGQVHARVDDGDDDARVADGRRPDLRDPDLLEVLLVRVEGIGRAAVSGPGRCLDDRVRDDEEHARVCAERRADLAGLAVLRDDDAALAEPGRIRSA